MCLLTLAAGAQPAFLLLCSHSISTLQVEDRQYGSPEKVRMGGAGRRQSTPLGAGGRSGRGKEGRVEGKGWGMEGGGWKVQTNCGIDLKCLKSLIKVALKIYI